MRALLRIPLISCCQPREMAKFLSLVLFQEIAPIGTSIKEAFNRFRNGSTLAGELSQVKVDSIHPDRRVWALEKDKKFRRFLSSGLSYGNIRAAPSILD